MSAATKQFIGTTSSSAGEAYGGERQIADNVIPNAGWDLYSGATVMGSATQPVLTAGNELHRAANSTMSQSAIFEFLVADALPFRPSNSIDRILNRLRQLRRLSGGRGGAAAAPIQASVDRALLFIARAEMPLPPSATLDDEGIAIIEMESEDAAFFADISFSEDGTLEVYRREQGLPSIVRSGRLEDGEFERFLRDEIGVLI